MKSLVTLLLCPVIAYSQYQVLSKTSGSKTTIVTQWTEGYVQKVSGERFVGKIQLKVVNQDTIEVRYKNSNKEKSEFPRNQVKSFGRLIDVSHHSNNPRNNFQPGYVVLLNGTKLEGKVRMIITEVFGSQVTFPNIIQYGDANDNLREFTSAQASEAVFTIDGVEISYEGYKAAFLERVAKGKLNVLPNPYPTTEAQFATDVAKAIDSAVTKKPSNAVVYRNEYLIRKENESEYRVVTPHNYEAWAKELIASCSAFNLLDSKSRNEFTHWSKLADAVRYYNVKCK